MSDSGPGGVQDPGSDGERSARLRAATERAMLELSGEVGYRNVTVAALVGRGGWTRSRFYSTFGSKDECYASASAEAIKRFEERLLLACDDIDGWVEGMRRALAELAAFVAEDRHFAAGVLVGVHSAGGVAAARRSEAWARLADAIDRGRKEVPVGQAQPPSLTATFILQAIEATVIRNLSEDRSLVDEMPALLYLAVAPYLGPTAAWSEVSKRG